MPTPALPALPGGCAAVTAVAEALPFRPRTVGSDLRRYS